MVKNFWAQLSRPIFALAPMANVTDAAFRRMFAKYGKPDVLFTEFVSVDGLLSAGREKLLVDFWFTEAERPIVAQIFGSEPDHFEQVAGLIAGLGFDGIDINMGCPDKNVEKHGGGAGLINDPARAAAIIRAVKRGAPSLPVSVKTRIGYDRNQLDEWLPVLLEQGIAALTVHLRTREEMSLVPAHWELAPQVGALRDRYAPQTRLLGNGDVETLADGRAKAAAGGLDGVMIGRGAFGKPWFFSDKSPSLTERLRQLVEHAALFEELYAPNDPAKRRPNYKPIEIMNKHYKAYCVGFDGAKDLRMQLMATTNTDQVREIVESFLVNRELASAELD